MKPKKLGVVLLALLLAAMTIVPCVSAAATCEVNGLPVDNTGGHVDPGESINLLEEFGLKKPADSEYPFRTYADSKEIADRILVSVDMTDKSGSVIGMYDLGDTKVLLINNGESVIEVVYDGKTVNTFSLVPELLGEKRESGDPKQVITGSATNGNYTVATETLTRLYSVTLESPNQNAFLSRPGTVLSTYIVKKSRTDVYRSGGMDIASLHTEGWFYVNYGSSITSIGDYSSYWVTSAPFWQGCEYYTQNLGVGTTAAQHKTHLKFGAPYVRHTMDMWVSCDAWLNANDGGSTNSWASVNGDACS